MNNDNQLELFKSREFQTEEPQKNEFRPNFFAFIKNHEKTIIIVILFFIISLISFSLGVENGKRISSHSVKDIPVNIVKEEIAPVQEKKIEITKATETKYTIQVATFKTETYAKKEAKRLGDKGFTALVIPKGSYVSVCVGNFAARQEANVALSQLKKTYYDCFVRKL